jgi:UDP-N-acetylmuramoyl-L-alanyl-D-glutamate--2,6-diaminopimelate ligase
MAIIACHVFHYPSNEMKVIGVTGTNGKTTITHLLEHILQSAGYRTGLLGTIGARIGGQFFEMKNTTQDALDLQRSLRHMRTVDTDYALMEVSSHALDMGRVKGVRFRSAIFTNLTQDHLDYHGTMDRYREAKQWLFARLDNGYAVDPAERQFAILNADDEASAYYAKATAAQVITYGIDRPADVRAHEVHISAQGTRFRCVTPLGELEIQLRLIGKFSVYNALAALAGSLAEGIPLVQIGAALATVNGVDGRFEAVEEGQSFAVIVDYAHTPDSLQNVLTTIREFARGRVICVFGCGGNRDKGKRPLMAGIAATYSDYVIATSDNPRFEEPEDILCDVERGFDGHSTTYELIVDRQAAIARAIALASGEDVVLIAGKGHETYQEIRGERFPSDDRRLARDCLIAKGKGSGPS